MNFIKSRLTKEIILKLVSQKVFKQMVNKTFSSGMNVIKLLKQRKFVSEFV